MNWLSARSLCLLIVIKYPEFFYRCQSTPAPVPCKLLINMTTSETTFTKFVIPVLTKFPVNIPPTYDTLVTLQTELNTNALGIRSSAGGLFGHLALTMDPAHYAVLTTNVAYVVPVNPGDNPIHAPGATDPEIKEANRAHLVAKEHYEKHHDTERAALKTQLISAIPDIFLARQKQPHLGYGARTTLQLLTHLWTSYGKIESSQLVENEQRMKAAWHPTEPIEKLFSQLKTTFEFAIAGNAGIAEITVVRIGYQIIVDTGLFKLELKEWRAKPDTDFTLDNFYTFFKAANIDRLATTADGGFHSANVSATYASKPITSNLAAAAPASDTVALQLKIAQLEKLLAKEKTKKLAAALPSGTTPATTYCWTHGTSKNLQHTSNTCKFKAPGHKDEATEENKMGGSTKIWTAPIIHPKE